MSEKSGSDAVVSNLVTAYAIAAPGAGVAIPFLDASGTSVTTFKVSPSCSAMRITVCLTTGSVFNLIVTNGATAYTIPLNGGVALTALMGYTFTVGARRYSTASGTTELSYSFSATTDSIIRMLFVEEVVGVAL